MRYIRLSDVNTILSWDKEAQGAYARAYASYIRAGSPPIPLGSTDYKTEYFRDKKNRRARENRVTNSKQGVAS